MTSGWTRRGSEVGGAKVGWRISGRGALAAGALVLVALAGCEAEKGVPGYGVGRIDVPAGTTALEGPSATAAGSPYNILLISIDTLRADGLGVYGAGRLTSPRIDAFAAAAVVFEQAFSQSPKTATSHMTLFTGLLPETHGVENWTAENNKALAAGIPTLASTLKHAGYRTEAYTNGGNMAAELGFDRGFDVYVSEDAVDQSGAVFAAAAEALAALAAGGQPERRSPFFLFVHTYEVHDPYVPPAEYRQLFADSAYSGGMIDSSEELMSAAGARWLRQHEIYWQAVDLDREEDRRHLRDLYDAEIRLTDDLVGELLIRLEESDLERSTVVVLLSDHGEEFFEHGGVLHETVYQEVLQVPLIVRLPGEWPGQAIRRRVGEAVSLVDVSPTLLDVVGLPIPAHMQGRSLLPLLSTAESEPRFVLSQYLETGLGSLSVGPWKYVLGQGGREELYDLAADPGERRDVLREHRPQARYLRSKLQELLAWCRQHEAAAGEGPPAELEDRLREQLEALGYLGAARQERETGPEKPRPGG